MKYLLFIYLILLSGCAMGVKFEGDWGTVRGVEALNNAQTIELIRQLPGEPLPRDEVEKLFGKLSVSPPEK
jgi:hypothetical protein